MKSLEYLGRLTEAKTKVAINSGGLTDELLFGILEVLADIKSEIKKNDGIFMKREQLTKQQIVDILKETGEDEKELNKLTKEQLLEKLK